ncbi:MAG TPA: methyltransferase domain-containing protein [Candidatus Dormibacteraeota bacterium]|nr:methyltransferase domain-containing protein [Candidatus Dormibacteraeota bacterium]
MTANGLLRGVAGALLDPLGLGADPDPEVARRLYRLHAPTYELLTAAAAPWRDRAAAALGLEPGDRVIDVGCGSGLNLPHLERRVGPGGIICGVDLSPDMLAHARGRAARAGWENLTLVEGTVEEAKLPAGVDAVLICAVHDVMRSPRGLARLAGLLRPGGRLVAAGCRWAPWLSPQGPALNVAMWMANRPFVTTFEGFDRPWSHLDGLLEDLDVEVVAGGCGYIARGTAPAPRRPRRAAAQRRGGPTEKL